MLTGLFFGLAVAEAAALALLIRAGKKRLTGIEEGLDAILKWITLSSTPEAPSK